MIRGVAGEKHSGPEPVAVASSTRKSGHILVPASHQIANAKEIYRRSRGSDSLTH